METINERLATLPDMLGYETPAALAKACGIDPNTLRKAMQGPSKPSFDLLQAVLVKHRKLSSNWLMLGEGAPMFGGSVAPSQMPALAEAKPARFTTAEETVEEASTLIKLAEAEADNRQLRQRLDDAREEILWLRGKSYPSSYAAAPEQPRMEIRRWGEVAAQAPKAAGRHFIMETNGEHSEVLAA